MGLDNIKVEGENSVEGSFTAKKIVALSEQCADFASKSVALSYIDCAKFVINRFASFGKTSCEWTLPVNFNKNAIKTVFDYFTKRGFKISEIKVSAGERDKVRISWGE